VESRVEMHRAPRSPCIVFALPRQEGKDVDRASTHRTPLVCLQHFSMSV
jgi:hypothetical protein